MVFVNYQKRKNLELFKSLEEPDSIYLSKAQNYVPIYTKFFTLNETNYNSINLNHKWYISNVNGANEEDFHLYNCTLHNIENKKVKDKEVFFKMAPLLDPYKYLIGKYNINDDKLYSLPRLNSTIDNCHPKFIDTNNTAYVDGLFLYFTSKLLHEHKFLHGVDYYGSFLGIKNDFTINVFDDIDYLNNSDFFNNNKNKLFKIDDYSHLFQNEEQKLKPINIDHNTSAKSQLSIKSFDNEIFEDIFEENTVNTDDVLLNEINTELNEEISDLQDLSNSDIFENKDNSQQVTLKSNSTCSSRSSYTNDDDIEECCENCDELESFDEECEKYESNETSDAYSENDTISNLEEELSDEESSDEDSYEEECIYATIPKFPVQIIGMEYCEHTFDDLILNEELKKEEWLSAFMQIIMILITYQKAFNFTHNDLHTNNVMYNKTDKKYIYYCYKKTYYKVPTFGRIFKIIDFGRSIYKFDGKLFCSDSFQVGGDAATQYNTEPYLNEKKPRLEPNFSFDLCRLACSIFDYIINDIEEVKDLSNCNDPIKRLIVEWCLDDKGINMLYKNNGTDRYPDFKLYKMIARCVHNHIPQAQLERPEFAAYAKFKGEIPEQVINIDNIPSYV
jgi:hypothetical protein